MISAQIFSVCITNCNLTRGVITEPGLVKCPIHDMNIRGKNLNRIDGALDIITDLMSKHLKLRLLIVSS